MSTKPTRREFLKAAGAAWIALLSAPGCKPFGRSAENDAPATASPAKSSGKVVDSRSPSTQPQRGVLTLRSRPDLAPPAVGVSTLASDTAPGHVFVAPKKGAGQYGPMILDERGRMVWFRPVQNAGDYAMDFKAQSYRGEPVITWAEGEVVNGHGLDEYIVLDSSYREIARVRAGNGYTGDHHEFLITSRDTALFTIYNGVPVDLSPFGGPSEATVLDGVVQEMDIESGEVLFEWHCLDHVGIEESYVEVPTKPGATYDYFHLNSVDVDLDDNLLISSRVTNALYKIDRETGEVMWRLGGKKSDFEMGPGTRTLYQHDARRLPDGKITIFDNGGVNIDEQSRGIVLELDEEEMSATLVRKYTHPEKLLAATQGNVQVLPNGNVFVGWGSSPVFSEFTGDGEMLFSANFLSPDDESYRAFRFPWSGRPADVPALVAERNSDEEVLVYVSWNGATEVASWEVLAGAGFDQLEHVGSAPHNSFETAITVNTAEPYIGVQARDRSGRVLGAATTESGPET